MVKAVIGADRVMGKLRRLKTVVDREVNVAMARNGDDLIRTARILHPGDGDNKAEITGSPRPDGSYLADFGSRAKVTEGDNAPRPFVNPALTVTAKRRKARGSRAVSKAVKEVFGNGS